MTKHPQISALSAIGATFIILLIGVVFAVLCFLVIVPTSLILKLLGFHTESIIPHICPP